MQPHPVTPGELMAHCRTRLTAYKVPREIHIVAELPRNSSGKVDKRVLQDHPAMVARADSARIGK
jgi:acyl-coenzyme A synthetase/AMP-(fatty) acid ligase